jgi:DNA (cytosine-5)-methyltransferase 1
MVTPRAYYNEIEPYAAAWLRNLIEEGLIPHGDVDGRDIRAIDPRDLEPYTQCHFFAGLGGWGRALRLAGWPDSRPVWTGSCPCQPFSAAGKRKGFADERHLWPDWLRLIQQRRPTVVFGEQVASATQWLGLVRGDLEAMEYAVGAMPIEAACSGADHLRDRIWFVAVANGDGEPRLPEYGEMAGFGCGGDLSHALSGVRDGRPVLPERETKGGATPSGLGSEHDWIICGDGKARRVKSGIRLLAHEIPARVAKLRAIGNAIDAEAGAAFVTAAGHAIGDVVTW